MGSGAKGNNFVFAPVSPPKTIEDETKNKKVRSKPNQPPAKKPKVSRALDENSKSSIFNLL